MLRDIENYQPGPARLSRPVHTGNLGFTLLELLVATAVLALIVLVLSAMLSTTGSSWQAAVGRSESGLSARAIADYIQTDLRPALLPVNPSDTANLQFILNPPAAPKNGDALFWQSPVANDTTYGDIAEVGYFVKWIADSNNTRKPVLCRFFVEPTDAAAYEIYKNPGAWLTAPLIDSVAPGTPASNYKGLFAENVVGIWFRCLDGAGKAYAKSFDSRTPPSDSLGKVKHLPAAVQVSFVLISSKAASRITGAQEQTLTWLVGQVAGAMSPDDSSVSPAEVFVSRALGDSNLKGVAAVLRPYTTTVNLVNAL